MSELAERTEGTQRTEGTAPVDEGLLRLAVVRWNERREKLMREFSGVALEERLVDLNEVVFQSLAELAEVVTLERKAWEAAAAEGLL